MIKVIKHGNKKQTTCKQCGCVFTYEKEDVKASHIGMNEFIKFVICPDCGGEVIVSYL